VQKGQLLAVVWSRDLGAIKSQLVDALTNLRTDEETLRRVEELFRQNGSSERTVRDARQKVQSDKNAVATAERSLKTARLTDEEIAAVRTEAAHLVDTPTASMDLGDWARVELRAPRDGVILEMNVSDGLMVDTSTDLFKIADLSSLAVWAHVYEDDLPALLSLPRPIQCKLTVPGRPGGPLTAWLDQIGSVVDPNQNTALVSGRVENPTGDLKIGQFVTIRISVPPPADALEIPTAAVVEDGNRSVVFVRKSETECSRVTVHVLRRTHDRVFVRADSAGLSPGDPVVTTGALLLSEVMGSVPTPTQR
jgi:cobalt-zinc-cadmium efflux system membrane fusion protein